MVGLSSLKDRFGSKKKESGTTKVLPDTAKDIYGEVDLAPPGAPANKPVEQQPSAPPDLPDVNFKPKEEHKIIPDEPQEIPSVEEELMFDDAMSHITPPTEAFIDEPYESAPEKPGPVAPNSKNDSGFFSEFQRFLDGNDIPKVADDLIGKDLVEKMKEFHTHKEEGKPYYFHSEELKSALKESLTELRNLERDWFIHKKKISQEEVMLANKEEELAEKVQEVKSMLHQIKVKDDFSKEIPEAKQFKLSNGQLIKSLASLSTALSVMDDVVFKTHVAYPKNDFASWIRAVLGNDDLGKLLYECKTKEDMMKALSRYEKGE